ncbi:MAG: tRNA (adenosine(37)-N6)-threonylcarbamoyltransferase complex dimerization subunit type 1 TsaB [Candidatus Kapabacteria bacterium]|nr:tRNA (adenosine(37)-N6)-threonylcarbamoyltransferase complex dimerization subunit type 1 TsaB [Ignavibacteriota bacterium]MCW5885222.1 tRNA (adenosine(37)-N6)-threonylcarbamoyltransferase complex dimerization subunit type 1 TsaB [Candidatus Kapabacteria bacterium]
MKDANYILSLESSENNCGVAISLNDEIIAEVNYFGKNLHDKLMAELIKSLMKDMKISYDELSAVAVSAGPGSFTGLRISASIAKGICFGSDTKLIAVESLSAYAYSALETAKLVSAKNISSIIKSNAGQVYLQNLSVEDLTVSEIYLLKIEEASNFLPEKTILVGSGANIASGYIYLKDFILPKVSFISKYAYRLFEDKMFTDAETYEPLYIQDFVPKTSTKSLSI